jgi:hypothetical protein
MQPSGNLDATPGNRCKVSPSAKIVAARREAHSGISSDDPARTGNIARVIWHFWDAGFTRSCHIVPVEVVDLGEIEPDAAKK